MVVDRAPFQADCGIRPADFSQADRRGNSHVLVQIVLQDMNQRRDARGSPAGPGCKLLLCGCLVESFVTAGSSGRPGRGVEEAGRRRPRAHRAAAQDHLPPAATASAAEREVQHRRGEKSKAESRHGRGDDKRSGKPGAAATGRARVSQVRRPASAGLALAGRRFHRGA